MNSQFIIGPKLTQGGMAEILVGYRIMHGQKQLVCLKKLLGNQSSKWLAIEAMIGRFINHPNCVYSYGLWNDENSAYLSMQYLPGINLRYLLHSRKGVGLPPEVAVYVAREIARGLSYLHRATPSKPSIIHLDISPQNVMLQPSGAVKIIDFGAARIGNKGLNPFPYRIIGKSPYLSPEFIARQPLGIKSDIYALGIVLWEMLAGRQLFPNQLKGETRRVRWAIDQLSPKVDWELRTMVLKALAFDPRDRFAGMPIFENHLTRYLVQKSPQFSPKSFGSAVEELTFSEQGIEKAGSLGISLPPRADDITGSPTRKLQAADLAGKSRLYTARRAPSTRRRIFVSLIMAGLIGLGALWWERRPVNWRIAVSPARVKLVVDGSEVANGEYTDTPIVLKEVPPKVHSLLITREGFDPYRNTFDLTESKYRKLDVVLVKSDRMAPTLIRFVSAIPTEKFRYSINDGLYSGTEESGSEVRFSDLTYGRRHQLTVEWIGKEDEPIKCQFRTKANDWEKPFILTVLLDKKKCFI